MRTLSVVLLAFLSGALPLSVWVGQLWLHTDIRSFGDTNPGATNVFRASQSRIPGVIALLLDFLKGALPVGLAHLQSGITGWPLVAVALAPILGHAFSPFLRLRGGKAVAVTSGVWYGLTIWEGPTVGGFLLGLAYFFLAVDGWVVIIALTGMLLYLLATPPAWNGLNARPESWVILATGLGNLLILAWKQRADLARPLTLRSRHPKP